MHKLNVLIFGPSSFVTTLNELKPFLKFNPLKASLNQKPSIILYHIDALQDKKQREIIDSNNAIKICAGKKKNILIDCDGYIELPTRLGDNLVFENKKDHIWWFAYDDVENLIIASKKNQILEPFITVSTAKFFEDVFRESLVIELFWENKIEYKIDDSLRKAGTTNVSFFKIIRKYLSKKIRTFLR